MFLSLGGRTSSCYGGGFGVGMCDLRSDRFLSRFLMNLRKMI